MRMRSAVVIAAGRNFANVRRHGMKPALAKRAPISRLTHPVGMTGRRFQIPFLLLLVWAGVSDSFAKHVAPPRIERLVHEDVRYVAPNDHGLRAYVEAWDVVTGRKLWMKTIVRHFYFPFAPTECMQYEYISSMDLSDGHLILTTDRGRVFSLALQTRTVQRLRTTPGAK